MKNRYKNPWSDECNTPREKFYENDAPCIFEYRGVKVFRLLHGRFDYVLKDCAITQRAGFKKEDAPQVIDDILDGETPVSDGVYSHLKKCGNKPMTYDQYTKLWEKGLRK